MIWTLIVLVFVGTNALFGGMFLGFSALGWQRKPPLRIIALAGEAIAAVSLVYFNGMAAVPSTAVLLFSTGILFIGPANERLWIDTCAARANLPGRVVDRVRLFGYAALLVATAGLAFIDGPIAILAAGFSFVCALVLALHPEQASKDLLRWYEKGTDV